MTSQGLMWTTVGAIILVGFATLLPPARSGDGKGERGNVPVCQQACLSEHTIRMEEANRIYGETGNQILFQDHVRQTVNDYSACIENCRIRYPVK